MKIKLTEEQANLIKQKCAARPEYESSKMNEEFGIEYTAEAEYDEKNKKIRLTETKAIQGFEWFPAIAVIIIFSSMISYYAYLLVSSIIASNTSNLVQYIVVLVILIAFSIPCVKFFVIDYIKKCIAVHKQKVEDKEKGIVRPKPKMTAGKLIMRIGVWAFIIELVIMAVCALPEIFFEKILVPHEYLPYVLLPLPIIFAVCMVIVIIMSLIMGTMMFIKTMKSASKRLEKEDQDE